MFKHCIILNHVSATDNRHECLFFSSCLCYCTLQKVEIKEKKANGESISPTFADLPAPELQWEKMTSAPVPRLDGFAIQIENLFYVFAGYGTIDVVRIFVNFFIVCVFLQIFEFVVNE